MYACFVETYNANMFCLDLVAKSLTAKEWADYCGQVALQNKL